MSAMLTLLDRSVVNGFEMRVGFNRMRALRQGFKPLLDSGTSSKLDRALIQNPAAPGTYQII
ncbi:hypothetical protein QUB68_08820 [Microcoleus sp. A006_D1]|uniref:hypothetical protein n=1 Tax=Microcoleus sp. A006_D1 TaxID=3055267 RepID=UPI002FD425F0